MNQEINILEVLEEREKRQNKADALKQQYEAEISCVIQKHQKVLDEFNLASDGMKQLLEDEWIPILPNLNDEGKKQLQLLKEGFVNKWNPLLSDYNNEVTKIRRKYIRLAKEL